MMLCDEKHRSNPKEGVERFLKKNRAAPLPSRSGSFTRDRRLLDTGHRTNTARQPFSSYTIFAAALSLTSLPRTGWTTLTHLIP